MQGQDLPLYGLMAQKRTGKKLKLLVSPCPRGWWRKSRDELLVNLHFVCALVFSGHVTPTTHTSPQHGTAAISADEIGVL
jgi:hypothetical protein